MPQFDYLIKYNKPIFKCPLCGGRRRVITTAPHTIGIQYDGRCLLCGVFTSIVLDEPHDIMEAYKRSVEALKSIPAEE